MLRSLALWAPVVFLFVALWVPGLSDLVQWVDDRVHDLVVDAEASAAVTAAEALDVVGSSFVTWPLIALVSGLLAWRRRWEALGAWVLAMAASQLLIGPMKALYGRARPPGALTETSGAAFPSGHAVAGAAIAVALVIVLIPAGPRRRRFELVAVALAAAMASSRVYLRAHWLSDVIAGAALGAAIAIGAAALVHHLDEHRHGAHHPAGRHRGGHPPPVEPIRRSAEHRPEPGGDGG